MHDLPGERIDGVGTEHVSDRAGESDKRNARQRFGLLAQCTNGRES